MKKFIFAMLLVSGFCGCDSAPDVKTANHPYKRFQLVIVEGDDEDMWEVWQDTASGREILCHHSGDAGYNGGRSTSCFIDK